MSSTHKSYGAPASCGRPRPCQSGWPHAFVLAAVLVFILSGSQAGAAVSPNGEVNGLKAKFVDVNGIRTRYYEMGQGEPMVLIHGEGFSGHSSANVWSKNIPGLAQRFHVFAPDKLASGMTDNPKDDKDYNIQGEVEHIYEFIQTMKLGTVHLVGQSRGGGCAFFLALAHPEIVRTLVVIDSLTAAPEGPTTRQEALARCPKEPDFDEWKCRLQAITFRPDLAFDDEYFEAGKYMASLPKSQQTVAKMESGAGEPLNSQFNDWKQMAHDRVKLGGFLQMPVLLYWAHDDPSAILARGRDLYDVIAAQNPKAHMMVVNKAGHFHFREYPDEFNYNVIHFIDYWEHPPAKLNPPAMKQAQVTVSPNGEVNGLKAKFVDVNGIRTRYYEMGQGEPMVLVHGAGWSGSSSANAWSRDIRGLAQQFHVFAPDKTGSGMTDNPKDDKDYNLQGEIDHIYQFILTMKLGSAHLIGQSHGSADVLFLAVEHPEVVRSLVLCDTGTASPVGPTTRAVALASCRGEGGAGSDDGNCAGGGITFTQQQWSDPEFMNATFGDQYFATMDYMKSLPKAKETAAKIKAGAGAPLYDARPGNKFNEWKTGMLARIQKEGLVQVPILLYWGRNDPSAMWAAGWKLYDVLAVNNPQVRMLTINKAGHFHFREYPEEFVYNVTNFIDYWEHHPAEMSKAAGR